MKSLVLLALLSASITAQAADPLPRASPASVGMSQARLERIDQWVNAGVAGNRIPGAVVAVARKGKLVYFKAFGYSDKAAGVPMTTDSIFSIASMTKPMATVGALMLFEDGQLMIGDPVSRYLPAMGRMQVAVGRGDVPPGSVVEVLPAKRQMTIHDLMRHTSGLLYGYRGSTTLHKMYPSSASPLAPTVSGAEFVDKLAALPLAYQPGTVWDYSLATDVLGVVVERVSGKRLGEYLQQRVFAPLGMTDTGFVVPASKTARYARALPLDPDSGQPQPMLDATRPLAFDCAGSCAVSTAGDYLRFAQMLLNRGTLDGTRILAGKTVDFMTSDHLGPEIENNIPLLEPQRSGYGFGLGVAVRKQNGLASIIGTAGDYFWNGAYGTSFWVDPKEELAAVFMMHAPGSFATRALYRQAITSFVLQAIER